jgi:hypothetical protein
MKAMVRPRKTSTEASLLGRATSLGLLMVEGELLVELVGVMV